jgi:geranylgeranyl pyrophosphate synthase
MPFAMSPLSSPVSPAALLTPPPDELLPEFGTPAWLEWRYAPARLWIDAALKNALETRRHEACRTMPPEITDALMPLWDATLHACLLGGKRVRPLLMLLVAEMFGIQNVQPLQGMMLAVEFTHAQSLVFDDLPCMDYDEATAILVGDGLASLAYACLVSQTPCESPEQMQRLLHLVERLGEGASFNGLINGQYADMVSHRSPASLAHLRYIHANKTGALLKFSILAPALLHGVPEAHIAYLNTWADLIGQLFQATDDMLDATQSTAHLGKTSGKDAEQDKLTYIKVLGLEGTRQAIAALEAEGRAVLEALSEQGLNTHHLHEFQTFLVHRHA